LNTDLAPTYKNLYGNHWVLWFENSNRYSVIDKLFNSALDLYFKSKDKIHFIENLKLQQPDLDGTTVSLEILDYLESCNEQQHGDLEVNFGFNPNYRVYKKHYQINNKHISLHSNSEKALNLVHPQLAFFETEEKVNTHINFDICLIDDDLLLFNNGFCVLKAPKQDYHYLRGKFVMQLICKLYNTTEADWLGTFHGTTVTDGYSSILFIGQSGSGKSTLSIILASNGYYVLADDVSPMLAENNKIYYNPNGVSIKESATSTLKDSIPNLDDLPKVTFNKSKGPIRYYTAPQPPNTNYPCHCIILVDYTANSQTQFIEVGIDAILETLIPESWLSTNPVHAKKFLNWLDNVKFFKLTYSDNASMIKTISRVFEAEE